MITVDDLLGSASGKEDDPKAVKAAVSRILDGIQGPTRRAVIDQLRVDLREREMKLLAERGSVRVRRELMQLWMDILREVADVFSGGMRIERAQSSRSHELFAALRRKDHLVFSYDCNHPVVEQRMSSVEFMGEPGHVFVVEHDWAAAFAGAQDFDDAAIFRLPFDRCVFEFSVCGRRVIAHCIPPDDPSKTRDDFKACFYLELRTSRRGGWFAIDPADEAFLDFSKMIFSQMRAISVSMEAEVAEAETVRIPEKLRRARERDGKLPPFDHHVVKLHRRVRAARYEGEHSEGARKRLHFRRGHWRHYDNHKTWIKWMLVGNPDLGFVDKEYRL